MHFYCSIYKKNIIENFKWYFWGFSDKAYMFTLKYFIKSLHKNHTCEYLIVGRSWTFVTFMHLLALHGVCTLTTGSNKHCVFLLCDLWRDKRNKKGKKKVINRILNLHSVQTQFGHNFCWEYNMQEQFIYFAVSL